jgi:carbon storage regulator CsrA
MKGIVMLILNRNKNEAIVLNGVIRIVILGTEPHKVKIGIEAPPDVIVVREELLTDERIPTPASPRSRHIPELP